MLAPVDEKTRAEGRIHELDFWRQFVTSERFHVNWCQLTPNPELELEIDVFVKTVAQERLNSGSKARILDIGSGPVSIITNSFPSGEVELFAADPLGDDYDGLWSAPYKNKVCRPVACPGEHLVRKFGVRQFDVVHIRNALDHSENPITVVQQMISVAKPGGYLIIHGFENEATIENWAGFHQWNITMEQNDLAFTGKDGVTRLLLVEFNKMIAPVRTFRRDLAPGRGWCGMIARVL